MSVRTKVKRERNIAKPVNPQEIKKHLDSVAIGQETAKRKLAVAVANHYARVWGGGVDDPVLRDTKVRKSNVLMIGPTGTGKTLLASAVAELLDVPFASCSATSLTEAGYVGDDVETMLKSLLAAADHDVDRAQGGIIYIDEIDKIQKTAGNVSITRDVGGVGVQQALLTMLEGSVRRVPDGSRLHPQADSTEIDTNNILFICGGAFIGLDDIVAKRRIGRRNGKATADVLPEDLIHFGLIPEFVGRLPVIAMVDPLDRKDLETILVEPRDALIKQYRKLCLAREFDLEFTPPAIKAIAGQAMELGIGARGLRSVLEKALLEVLFSGEPGCKYVIDGDVVLGKTYRSGKPLRSLPRPPEASSTWAAKTTLVHGDCRKELKKIGTGTIDAIITDPIYPEVSREYGRMSESEWHSMMTVVVTESRRVLKPKGSMVIILQPNSQRLGQMRLWLWEFLLSTAKRWNLVQDCYWWSIDALPLAGANRKCGLMRPSVKMCLWFGAPDCYRNQDNVLWTPSQATSAKHRSDIALRTGPSGRTYRNSTISKAADERGGTTPYNLLPIPTGGQPSGAENHPAVTPYDLAAWWCKYLLPFDGVLLDPFCGSGTTLLAGLNHGATQVIGIDKERKYLKITERRIRGE